MLAEVFDGVLRWLVFDANRENRVDYAEREVVVAIFLGLSQIREFEFGFTIGDKCLDFLDVWTFEVNFFLEQKLHF